MVTNSRQVESAPHVIIINAIQRRGPNFAQRQVARYAAQHVADKEDSGTEAVHGFAEFQRVEHLQFGKPDVHPVEVVEQVADEDEGDQTQGNAFVDGVLVVSVGQGSGGAL
ncbi:hypothetical protein TMM008_00020 [Pseudomonas sp. 008]|nr:hypothetical protein TMM008_00020 [Pseudomonas sp. 008]